jgi:hypothetical protein
MIFFIDESGHPHPHDSVSRPVLGAVGCGVSDSRDLTRQLHSIRRDIFGEVGLELEAKWKAHRILNERTFRRERQKWEYVESVFDLASNFPVVSFFIIMDKPQHQIEITPDLLPPHVRFLLGRVDAYMAGAMPERKALLVFDSQNAKADSRLSAAITNYLFRSPEGSRLRHVLETPLFVESSILPGIQIADLFVSCIRQFHERIGPNRDPADAYQRALARLHRCVKRTASDCVREDGTVLYAEYRMPARWWERPYAAKDEDALPDEVVEAEGGSPNTEQP